MDDTQRIDLLIDALENTKDALETIKQYMKWNDRSHHVNNVKLDLEVEKINMRLNALEKRVYGLDERTIVAGSEST